MAEIFVDLRSQRDFAGNAVSAKNVMLQTIDTAIRTQMALGKRQAIVDMATAKGSASNDDVRYALQELNRLGYRAQPSSKNTLEINW